MKAEFERAKVFYNVLGRYISTNQELLIRQYLDYSLAENREEVAKEYEKKYYKATLFLQAIALMEFEVSKMCSSDKINCYMDILMEYHAPEDTRDEIAISLVKEYSNREESYLEYIEDSPMFYYAILDCSFVNFVAWKAAQARIHYVNSLQTAFVDYIENNLFED